jgi:hypothetical protein
MNRLAGILPAMFFSCLSDEKITMQIVICQVFYAKIVLVCPAVMKKHHIILYFSCSGNATSKQGIRGLINNPVYYAGTDFPQRYSQYFLIVPTDIVRPRIHFHIPRTDDMTPVP